MSCHIQVLQQQIRQDDGIKDLAEGLQDTLAFANACPDLLNIMGATDVIKELIREVMEAASLIDEYTRLSFVGRFEAIVIRVCHRHFVFQEELFSLSYRWISQTASRRAKSA
jgi:hypothetical protein